MSHQKIENMYSDYFKKLSKKEQDEIREAVRYQMSLNKDENEKISEKEIEDWANEKIAQEKLNRKPEDKSKPRGYYR